MTTPIEKLTPKDYELLSYINKFDSISKAQINDHFKNKIDSIDYRLSQLSKVSYQGIMFIKDSSYIVAEYDNIEDPQTHITKAVVLDSFHITPLGKMALQDYNCKLKSDKRDFWRKSVMTPILVSIATNLAINGIKLLLPLILQLVERTP